MKLNHLNLTVPDVAETRTFFETYFGLTPIGEAPNDAIAALFDDDGFVLTLMRGEEPSYPRMFHIGFGQESEEQVNVLHQRLHADGFEVSPPKRAHGAWTFYFPAPGGIRVEVMHQSWDR